jgi:hypothetical protein
VFIGGTDLEIDLNITKMVHPPLQRSAECFNLKIAPNTHAHTLSLSLSLSIYIYISIYLSIIGWQHARISDSNLTPNGTQTEACVLAMSVHFSKWFVY